MILIAINPHQATGTDETVAPLDIPVFQTFEGYIIREGFAFSLGEASELELEPKDLEIQ